jgi:hypothetical protein
MNKKIAPNRWFIWTIVIVVVIGVSLWAYIQYALVEMDVESSNTDIVFTITIHKKISVDEGRQQNAIEIARVNKECSDVGSLSNRIIYNSNTKTWWVDLERVPNPNDGCAPACVVSEESGTAEVNWRCTGLLPE